MDHRDELPHFASRAEVIKFMRDTVCPLIVGYTGSDNKEDKEEKDDNSITVQHGGT